MACGVCCILVGRCIREGGVFVVVNVAGDSVGEEVVGILFVVGMVV